MKTCISHTHRHNMGKPCHKLNKKGAFNGECSKSRLRKLFLSNQSAHVGGQFPNKCTLEQREHLSLFSELAFFNPLNINQIQYPQHRISEFLVLH